MDGLRASWLDTSTEPKLELNVECRDLTRFTAQLHMNLRAT